MTKTLALALFIVLFHASASISTAQSPARVAAVPNDLVIKLSLGGTIQFSSAYDYTISADGIVRLDDHSHNLPLGRSYDQLLLLSPGQASPKPPKPPQLKERIADQQLLDLIAKFDASGFYDMNDRYYGDPALTEGVCVDHAAEKGLSITQNGKTKTVSFFLGCSYGEASPLKRFLVLYDQVSDSLKGVKVTPAGV